MAMDGLKLQDLDKRFSQPQQIKERNALRQYSSFTPVSWFAEVSHLGQLMFALSAVLYQVNKLQCQCCQSFLALV